jgi:CheY-like chemotaxis protein
MRCIVRKVLAATRFPLQVAEAVEGGEALALVRTADFVFVLFDQNLPGLSGLEAIAELRRAERNPDFVLISSTEPGPGRKSARRGRRSPPKAVLSGGSGRRALRLLRVARA